MTPLLTIAQGDASRISEPRRMLARSEEEWRALWALHAGPEAPSPALDFAQVMAAAAFAGERPSAGHSIHISAVPAADGDIHLVASERAPGPGIAAAAMITSPFHIVAVSRDAGEVSWDDPAARPIPPASPPRSAPIVQSRAAAGETLTTGMDPRTASALAYLAGPFSGALILFAESRHPGVRFHAWQSILALGGLGLAVIVLYVLASIALFVSAGAVSAIFYGSYVIWAVVAVVWVLCLWKALSGERWKLPLAGQYAERLANRHS